MQIIKDIEQGSPEWHKLRMGVATASNFSKIVTSTGAISKSIDDYALKLAAEYFLIEPEETYKSAAMERGTELEPDARQAYEEYLLSPVEQATFIKSDCGNFGYSPDGLVSEDGLIELKARNDEIHFGLLLGDSVDSGTIWQMNMGMLVSGRKWCDFGSYNPNFKQSLFIKRFYPDLVKFESLLRGFEIGEIAIRKLLENENIKNELANVRT